MASTSQAALLSVQGKGATKNSSPEQPAWKSLTELDMNITGRSLQARCTYECIRMYTHAHTDKYTNTHKTYTHTNTTQTHTWRLHMLATAPQNMLFQMHMHITHCHIPHNLSTGKCVHTYC